MAPSTANSIGHLQHEYIDTDDLRTAFALAMSAMYKREVPLYGTLIRIVRTTNDETLATSCDARITALKNGDVGRERLDLERHGAIRLGTPFELQTVRRIFAIIGLYPVGYYDLSPAGLPMHATCFRPTTSAALKKNPFRVFTTLLRPELLKDAESRDIALDLLSRRCIFSSELLELLGVVEKNQGGHLSQTQGDVFVREAMKTFGWRPVAAASREIYQKMKDEHPILADVACFRSSHINHLTPRTLDISAAQERMKAEGLAVKDRIEGPPVRQCPILLRQTSFLALEERILFPGSDSEMTEGFHKARFGEIEERGAAVTREGRKLYDRLLEEAMRKTAKSVTSGPIEHSQILSEVFQQYPDTWKELCRRRLVYFTFRCAVNAKAESLPIGTTRDELLAQRVLEAVPITYEDFLPLSAAGIFQSNLQSGSAKGVDIEEEAACPDKIGYENALGGTLLDLDKLYEETQVASLKTCALELGLGEQDLLN
ncbi:DUF1338-domain-containing protein [Melanomma pulvis-pyrius CBS 109.77]|uniref:2-oxoadipate dioxygenase/decarboxylase n=1 Tax=Melanomma pulvis-pyrius CBS 109.77 TaxID=1314802 RepID=A0A6A6XRB0_9PLEO|nr:DUF1338-domain-containing protein [Melanomma pulvis-pyrius CBS 109.77]